MKIETAQKEKSKIEEKITEMLNDFELKTGCMIAEISLNILPGMIVGKKINNVNVVAKI